MPALWVNLTPGVPATSDFMTTGGQGGCLCVNVATNQGYYLKAGDVVTALAGGGGSGTVTSVSVTTANGVSGVVATPTVTPAITITLGAITPSSIAATGTITGTNLSGTNTGDQTITLTGNVTGTGTGSFATTIAAGVVTLAMQANMATGSLVYRKTALAGAPEIQTLATLKTDLLLTGTNSGDQTTVSGNAGSATILQTARNISISGKATAAGGTFDGSAALILNVTAVTLVAGDIPNIAESQVTNLITDLAAKSPLASPVFTGMIYFQQPTPTAKTAAATLTIAELLTGIVTYNGVAAGLTLPTGTLTDAGILAGALAVDRAFEWTVINIGAATATMTAGVGHTYVGAAGVVAATSARFWTRKTAANTFVTYRTG